jgi:beta-lactamase class A
MQSDTPASLHVALLERPQGAGWSANLARVAWKAEQDATARFIGLYLAPVSHPDQPLAAYRADETFPAASVIKVAVMLTVERAWNEGKLTHTPKQDRLLRAMIQASDNAATDELIGLVGMDAVNDEARRQLGRPEPITKLIRLMGRPGPPKNRTSPRETAYLMARIAQADEGGERAGREMLQILRGTVAEHRMRIPQGVPARYRSLVGNKTGTIRIGVRVVNDAAIVETPEHQRYVLVLLTEGAQSERAIERVCVDISRQCWLELQGRLRPAPEPAAGTRPRN